MYARTVFTSSLDGALPGHRDPRSQSIELGLHGWTSGVLPLPALFPFSLDPGQDVGERLEGLPCGVDIEF